MVAITVVFQMPAVP